MDYKLFFTHQYDLPEGVGFALWGREHLLWLAGILLATVVFTAWYMGQSEADHQRISRRLAWVIIILTGLCYLTLFLIDRLGTYNLPLHLCTMAPFLCLLFAYTQWDWLGQTIYGLCLPGTIAALLFPDWTMYPQFNFMNLHSFVLHGLLVIFPVCQLFGGTIRPRLRSIWKPWVFLAVVVPPVYWFNLRFGTNYYFLNAGSKDSPLAVLYQWFGERYLIAYALLVLAVMLVLFLPWQLFAERDSR